MHYYIYLNIPVYHILNLYPSFFPFLSFNSYMLYSQANIHYIDFPCTLYKFTCGYPSKRTWYPLHTPLYANLFFSFQLLVVMFVFLYPFPVIYYAYEFTPAPKKKHIRILSLISFHDDLFSIVDIYKQQDILICFCQHDIRHAICTSAIMRIKPIKIPYHVRVYQLIVCGLVQIHT